MKLISTLFCVLSLLVSAQVYSAPESRLLPGWDGFKADSQVVVAHDAWQSILDKYLVTNNRQTFFNYADVNDADKQQLDGYINALANLDPLMLNRREQKAYWINLYNALTVKLIVDNRPVKTITKLGDGLFQFGPWDDEIVKVNGKMLTLNNIEHGILRPIYQDARIHYAVNCASLGCPNLNEAAYTSANTEALLEASAKDFINHPRGVAVEGNVIKLSLIFKWYKSDFSPNVLSHIVRYAEPALVEQLAPFADPAVKPSLKPKYAYDYNWYLNSPTQ